MPEVICNTSPLQYLYHLGRLDLLPSLVSRVVVPTAVAAELAEGRRLGLDLPTPENLPWVDLREAPVASLLPLVAALGPGETAPCTRARRQVQPNAGSELVAAAVEDRCWRCPATPGGTPIPGAPLNSLRLG